MINSISTGAVRGNEQESQDKGLDLMDYMLVILAGSQEKHRSFKSIQDDTERDIQRQKDAIEAMNSNRRWTTENFVIVEAHDYEGHWKTEYHTYLPGIDTGDTGHDVWVPGYHTDAVTLDQMIKRFEQGDADYKQLHGTEVDLWMGKLTTKNQEIESENQYQQALSSSYSQEVNRLQTQASTLTQGIAQDIEECKSFTKQVETVAGSMHP